MTPLRLAILNLLRRRFTSMIALLALALPVAAGGTLHRVHHLAEARYASLDSTPDLVIGAKAGELDILLNSLNGEGDLPDVFTYNLYDGIKMRFDASYRPDSDGTDFWPPQEREHNLEERHEVLRHTFGLLIFGTLADQRVIGTTKAFWQRPSELPKMAFAEGGPPTQLNEIAVGAALAAQRNWHIGKRVKINPWISRDQSINDQLPKVHATISGILQLTGSYWDHTSFATIEQAQLALAMAQPFGELHPVWQQNVLHYIVAYDLEHGFPVVSQLVNNATVAQAISVPLQIERLYELTGVRQRVGLLISILALAIGALAVVGIMVTRFDHMRAQLNVLRAIGYRKREISGWLLWEGALLGAAGIFLGALLDFVLFTRVSALSGIVSEQASLTVIPLWYSSPVWLCALGAAMLATLIPLWRIFRDSVHHGLRQS